MENDLISRAWLLEQLDGLENTTLLKWSVLALVNNAPRVEVVRCKDCKHLNVLNRKDLYAHCPKTNTVFFPFELDTRTHFCSLGERKDND